MMNIGPTPPLDRKGIFTFLGITFLITYLIEGALILGGVRFQGIGATYGQLVVVAAMWVPALATVLTTKLVSREGLAIANIRFGAWRPYLAAGVLIPLCFAIIYALTWLLGLGQPDWQLVHFQAMIVAAGAEAPPMPPPLLIWTALFVSSLLVAPVVNGFAAYGEELGWRGYLLPKLMPLGRVRAYLVLGLVWGLWHLPLLLAGFTYPGQPFLGTLAFMGMTTTFGIYLNELTLRNRSSILAGWGHGVFNSQALGIWRLLFPDVNPLIGGYAGLVGIAVWLALGMWQATRPGFPSAWLMAIHRQNSVDFPV